MNLAKYTNKAEIKTIKTKDHWNLVQIPILMKQTKFQTKIWQNGYSMGNWDPIGNLRRLHLRLNKLLDKHMLLFYYKIFITGKFEIYQMGAPILKKYNYSITYRLWLKLKRRQVFPSFLQKERNFKIVSIRQRYVLPFYRKTKLNYQRVKYTNENQNCYEGLT